MEGIILSEKRHKELLAYEKSIKQDSEYDVIAVSTDRGFVYGTFTKDELLKKEVSEKEKWRTKHLLLKSKIKTMGFWDRLFNWPFSEL